MVQGVGMRRLKRGNFRGKVSPRLRAPPVPLSLRGGCFCRSRWRWEPETHNSQSLLSLPITVLGFAVEHGSSHS